jgi:hypothetical protein
VNLAQTIRLQNIEKTSQIFKIATVLPIISHFAGDETFP